MPNIPRMATIAQTAKETGLAEYHIRQLCINREITAVRSGSKWLVNLDRLADYLNTPPAPTELPQNAIRRIAER